MCTGSCNPVYGDEKEMKYKTLTKYNTLTGTTPGELADTYICEVPGIESHHGANLLVVVHETCSCRVSRWDYDP